MEAAKLYNQLERDFITSAMVDQWAKYMEDIFDYLTDNFKKRSTGLVCDNAREIKKIYTAVFPSSKIMHEILDRNKKDAMLFVHHAKTWDTNTPEVWLQMERTLLEQFRKRKIAIYNLHTPLDNYGEYSTSVTLARRLGIIPKKAFALHYGALAGVFGKTNCRTISELRRKFESAIDHRTSIYNYGGDEIMGYTVAIVAGGGLLIEILEEIAKERINIMITGITCTHEVTKNEHEYAKKHQINLIGGTHYSTEKFACIAMCDYFKKLGLPAEFIEDEPVLKDL